MNSKKGFTIKPLGWVAIIILLGVLVWIFGVPQINKMIERNKSTEVAQTQQPQSAAVATTKPNEPSAQTTEVVAPVVSDTTDCGNKPVIKVHFDGYAGFYPLIVMDQTMKSDDYCLQLVPAWAGPDFDINGYDEETRAKMIKDGEFDVYFATNAVNSRYDGGIIIAASDQSAGADKIVAWNTAKSNGQPIDKFNDLKGLRIGIVTGSVGNFQVLSTLQTVGYTPNDVTLVEYSGTFDAIDGFNAPDIDSVAGWDPPIRDAIHENESKILVSSSWWRNITDYISISPNADTTKSDAILSFLRDYEKTISSFSDENLAETAQVIANWQWQGYAMNDWTFVSQDNAYDDLKSLVDNVAFASITDNYQIFQTKPDGSNYILDQLAASRAVWEWGGVQGQGIINGSRLQPKYVNALAVDSTLSMKGTFVGDFQIQTVQTPSSVDQSTLLSLPTIMELPYKEFKFIAGTYDLISGESEKLQQTGAAMASLMQTSDATIVVTGCSAWPSDTDTKASLINFGYGRAQTIQSILSDEMGIPITRIVVQGCAPDSIQKTEAERIPWRIVKIEVKRSSSER